jgi:exopolyphosphatase/guanosine-5'-triphosphate,3'-diphosphate pyrophosphatase
MVQCARVCFVPTFEPFMSRRAVIDIGTNSIKLLVGDVRDGLVQPVEERGEQTRLGAGFYETHVLQPVTIARTASAVARFVAMARDLEAESVRVIATSAARDARNPHDLTEAVRRASGQRVEIISGDQEAEWVYRGVTTDVRLHGQRVLILDVGGGSTEFVLGDHDHHTFRQSFHLGGVRLLEKLRPRDPPSLQDLADTRGWLEQFLQHQIGPALGASLHPVDGPVLLVGTGGTATLLVRMEKRLSDFHRDHIDGTVLPRAAVLDRMLSLWSLSLAERRQVPGLPPNRADVVLMGVAIFEAVMRHLDFDALHVSMRGLRFGALLDSP